MSKAEQRANEKYPLMQEGDDDGLEALKYIGIECDSVPEFNSIRYSQQAYFIEGYQQAEKDLALTWEDIRKIDSLCCKVEATCDFEEKEHYQEVLKRFKAQKGEKV